MVFNDETVAFVIMLRPFTAPSRTVHNNKTRITDPSVQPYLVLYHRDS